jgi:hypothetical protein
MSYRTRRCLRPGDFFFESGDINHTAQNKTDARMVHVLVEILPAEHQGPSIMPATSPPRKGAAARRPSRPPSGVSGRHEPIATLGAKSPREQFIVDAEPAFLLFGVGVLEGQQAPDEDRFPEPQIALSGPSQIA